MNNDFRQRVFLPIILPLGVIIGFFGFAWMLSRVLLAVEEGASTAIALGIAVYLLAIAAVVAARPRITSRALAVGVSLGLVALVAAGLIAAGVGPREIHPHGEEAAAAEGGEHGEGEAPEEDTAAAAGGANEWVAVDIEFESAPETVKAGDVTVVLVNNGQTQHNVTFPEVSDEPVAVANAGETVEGTAKLKPGTYEYICSVPGHEGSMNGELTVE